MRTYRFLVPSEHVITVRNRETGYAHQHKYWNDSVIEKVLREQKDCEDVYVTKYPSSRLIDTVILDFDSEDVSEAYDEVVRLKRYLEYNGLNSIIVKSGKKGYHLYIEIAPFLFKDTDLRNGINWNSYFNAFVCFLIHDNHYTYETLDKTNFSAGLNGNIRLIGSKHPSTNEYCQIIEGEFTNKYVVTKIQDEAQKKAFCKLEIIEEDKKRVLKKTKIVNGFDPIQNNDLRSVFKDLTGDIKLYPKGYGYCRCLEHNDEHPSLLVTKEWFSCSGCGFKGNIWTLKKFGYVKFDDEGKVK